MPLIVVPRTAFVTSGGNVAEDQFCQEFDAAFGGVVTIVRCNQDFPNVYVEVSAALSPAQQLIFDALVAAHTAVGRNLFGTLAALSPGLFVTEEAYVTNGLRAGELPGTGSGVPAWWDGTTWMDFATAAPVQV